MQSNMLYPPLSTLCKGSVFISHRVCLQAMMLVGLILASGVLHAAANEHCSSDNDIEIARIVNIIDAENGLPPQIELTTASTERLSIPAWQLETAAVVGQHIEIIIRRNTLGICEPFSVIGARSISQSGITVTPSAGQAYQGAFILDINRNCSRSASKQCASDQGFNPNLTAEDIEKLASIDPRSLASCSLTTLQSFWSVIRAKVSSKLFACVKDYENREIMVEFSIIKSDKSEKLAFSRLY